ncbi:UDP-N-acetylmuramoyl-tripeptide--D-alanyl-D-alanine ligase [Winogradskyella immobilis]|uniref:UDP-N-acetylmuramoyl-tripeptide--D-alanyl-D-alanine ligase n=1 Tax=Winogradskyella immobilis TaxID=2816852 RepID=A0ABS8EP03_9FLAO|nr:UDP-N-acetylmuramoyl-tripeptide--D-alanyl-D-alanine ligase [Winogradskyella immobilis]MCC1484757.1 UDP-N-acetylmuramoyl-tripeptide--D-alanyl-D-alanine ligase [Winogradskyella immobilis]MCG0016849.1 UDP-N-acetylmuramoyl-tripeptide--D-alanyl-D-alanine ligase [Winogradskyella immobilis]
MKIEELYNIFIKNTSVCTDTRKLKEGDLYFALKGENFNGNLFAEKALLSGASYCIIDDESLAKKYDRFILVKDVLQTLQDLAQFHRRSISTTIIGLTGSNGKTTTKELIYSVLNESYKVQATNGNFNNHIGVPLTLLAFNKDTEYGIVEMGANHQKEISFLSNIAEPDYGLITNFGKAHMEGFGGIEGIIKGKSELYDYLKTNSKTIFCNTDDSIQVKQIGSYNNVIRFGTSNNNDTSIQFKSADPFVSVLYNGIEIRSQLIGKYNYGNIASAVAIGHHFNVPNDKIILGIEKYCPKNNRSQIINQNSNKIILDAYNANPTSMLAALDNFKQLKDKNKMLFLGDMFELGNASPKEHQAIVDYLETNFTENIYIIGENFFITRTNSFIKAYKTFEDLKLDLNITSIKDSTILIKGSRGMALERILRII